MRRVTQPQCFIAVRTLATAIADGELRSGVARLRTKKCSRSESRC